MLSKLVVLLSTNLLISSKYMRKLIIDITKGLKRDEVFELSIRLSPLLLHHTLLHRPPLPHQGLLPLRPRLLRPPHHPPHPHPLRHLLLRQFALGKLQ